MKAIVSTLSCVLLATATWALPAQPVNNVVQKRYDCEGVGAGIESCEMEESDYESGAYIYAPAGTSFTSVAGTFNVPFVTNPLGYTSPSTNVVSIFVGITSSQEISRSAIRAGVSYTAVVNADASLTTSYQAYADWYPQNNVALPLTVNPGDIIDVTLTVTSPTSATVYMENVTKGKKITQQITARNGAQSIIGGTAQWNLDPTPSSNLVNLIDFDVVEFTGCSATTNTSVAVDLANVNEIVFGDYYEYFQVALTESTVTITYNEDYAGFP